MVLTRFQDSLSTDLKDFSLLIGKDSFSTIHRRYILFKLLPDIFMAILPFFRASQTEELGHYLDEILSCIILESPHLSVVGPPTVPSYEEWKLASHRACTSGKSKRLFEFLSNLMNLLIQELPQKSFTMLYYLKWENLFASGLRNYNDQIWLEIGRIILSDF
jgi:hypothetical protein